MGATYTRQSTYADGDTITAAHTNDEFDQLLAAFASSSGHTHDGTAAEGGPITKLLGNTLTFGAATSGTDITITFDGETNDGVLKWMEDEDYFEFSDDILVASTEKIQFRDTAIYINSSTDGQLDLVADTEIQIAATTIDIDGAVVASGEIAAASLDISGAIDVDGTANLDVVDIDGAVDMASTLTVAGVVDITDTTDSSDATGDTGALRTEGGASIAKKLYVGTDLDVDGTTNLDAVDIDGAVQLDATLTIGADDQGYDVILYGDTASANITWDTSADDLIFNGAAGLIVPDGQFTLGSTAVSATAAEINLIDGGTSRGTTAVASGDGILINDAGTMRMTNVDTVSTYFSSHSVGGSNIVTTGALNSGSITSGFGSIDIGSSALSTTGSVTLGATSFGDNDITNVGDIALDSISADGTDINVAVSDNSATALTIKQGSDAYLIIDTANSSESVSIGTGISGTAISIGHSTSEVTFGDNVTVTGDIDIDGTTNLDAVDIDGAVQLDATLTIGADDQGYDVILYGDTASANMTWDTSADDLIFNGAAGLVVPDGQLTLGSTAISATAAEINLIDGGTARGTTAVASGDGILINDGGTMRMTNVDTVSTYFSSHNVGGGNIVTTGALDSGSITSGFGAIDNGSSNITTTGVGSFGSLDISGAIDVDGTTNLDNTDIDGTLVVDGTNISLDSTTTLNIDNSNTSNGITIGTATSAVPVSIGHTTSETTVNDNLTVTGNLTVNGANNIRGGNIAYNGAMNIAQRGTSSTGIGASSGYFTLDRWKIDTSDSAGRLTMTQTADGPSGFLNCLKLECTTADTSIAAAENLTLAQKFEGQDLQLLKKGTSDAEQITVSFYVKGNASATYVCELKDNDNTRNNTQAFSVTTSWNRVSLTFAADTTGALDDDNNLSLELNIWLHGGSTYTGGTFASNTWASVTNANRYAGSRTSFFDSTSRTFFITGVQMEVGSSVSDFQYEKISETLANCQRYYQTINPKVNAIYASGYQANSERISQVHRLGIEMRAEPTCTVNGTFTVSNCSQPAFTSFSKNTVSTHVLQNSGSAASAYYHANDTGDFFSMDAEL